MKVTHSNAGTVVAVNGPAVGPASAITYDVRVNISGSPNVLFTAVVPWRPRWPEAKVDTEACPVETPVDVIQYGNDYYFDIPELPKVTLCP